VGVPDTGQEETVGKQGAENDGGKTGGKLAQLHCISPQTGSARCARLVWLFWSGREKLIAARCEHWQNGVLAALHNVHDWGRTRC
jgi:hypothetical protein